MVYYPIGNSSDSIGKRLLAMGKVAAAYGNFYLAWGIVSRAIAYGEMYIGYDSNHMRKKLRKS